MFIAVLFAGCKTEKGTQTATEPFSGTNIRIGGLKGPTSMGLVKLLSDNESKKTVNTYDFTMAVAADELTPKFTKGELDILAVPANVASVLYNKTNGKTQIIAVNMLGAVYIAEKGGNTVNSLADLKGKTIYATGKGTTPEYVLTYLLKQNGLDIEKDVKMKWMSEPTETVAEMNVNSKAVAMLPEPFLTVAQSKVKGMRTALDLYAEWEKLGIDSSFVTAGIIVRSDFAKKNPEAVKQFLQEYKASEEYVKENIDDSSSLIEKYGIVKAQIAKKALPNCNIVCITNDTMQKTLSGYLKVLYDQNPQSVGGKLPGEDFYLRYE